MTSNTIAKYERERGYRTRKRLGDKQLARRTLRMEIPNTPVEIERRPNPTGVVKTSERISGGRLSVTPKTYIYRPIRRMKKLPRGSYSGHTTIDIDEDTNKVERVIIVMPETVYQDKKTRDAIYAHEYAEAIKTSQGSSTKISHSYGIKAENAIAKKYGSSREKTANKARADFKEAYVSNEVKKKNALKNRTSTITQYVGLKRFF